MPPRHPNTPPPAAHTITQLIEDAYARRRAHDDPDLHLWSDTPADALAYLTAHQRVPHDVLVHDARTCLHLVRFLRAQLAAFEHTALTTCRTLGPGRTRPPVTWPALAHDLGVHSEQAAQQRHARLARTQAGERAHEDVHGPDQRAHAWTLTHGARVRTAAAALLRARADLEAEGVHAALGELDDLDAALDDYRGTHTQHAALLAHFRFLADTLPGRGAHIPAVRTAAELHAEYAAVRDGT